MPEYYPPMVDTKRAMLTLLALLVVGGGLGVAVSRLRLRWPGGSVSGPGPIGVPAAPPAPLLPSLENSDALVRSKATALSAHARFRAWLDADDLLRRTAAAADLIGRGLVPKDALGFLAPRGSFAARKSKGGGLTADPRSFARYDGAADAVASIDAPGTAALFRELEPMLQAACRDFGEKECDVRARFGRATRELLDAPALEGAPALKPSKNRLNYLYADERLEKLSAAQKQLLRMGPRNADKIKAKLLEFAQAVPLPVAAP